MIVRKKRKATLANGKGNVSKIGVVIKDNLLESASKKIKGFGEKFVVHLSFYSPIKSIGTSSLALFYDTKKDAMTIAKNYLKANRKVYVGGRVAEISLVSVNKENIITGEAKQIFIENYNKY